MKKVIVGIVALLLVGGGVYFFVIRDTSEPASDGHTDHSHDESSSSTDSTNSVAATNDVVITYTDSGFSPRDYAVLSGGTVTVRNDSSSVLDFASNDHPAHTDNSEMNVGKIAPGKTASFVVMTRGSWGFHNHENDTHTGKLVIE